MIEKKLIDELKSFYYQNVILHFYMATTILSAIILGVISSDQYWLIVITVLTPHAYEVLTPSVRKYSNSAYYNTGLIINGFISILFVNAVSYEPTLSGLLLLMYSYTLISYGGIKLWISLFPAVLIFSFCLYFLDGDARIISAPYQILGSSVVASCCFIIVTGSYRFEAGKRLIESKRAMERVIYEKETLAKNMSRYLSPKLVESLGKDNHQVNGHVRKEIVVFFSDICDFTSLSEGMTPEDMSKVLNEYLSAMSSIANKFDATLDKFIGDSVMIFFGAPSTSGIEGDVTRCLSMALEMKEESERLSKSWKDRGISEGFKVRMGIHHGWATVGNFGALDQMNYTVIGAAVNVAARLEKECLKNEILVSQKIKDIAKNKFLFDKHKSLSLKGVEKPVDTFLLRKKHGMGDSPITMTIEMNEGMKNEVIWMLTKSGVKINR